MTRSPRQLLSPTLYRRLPWLCGGGAFLLGLSDYLWLRLFHIDVSLRGADVTLWLVLFFAINFAVLGFVIGQLFQARERIRVSHGVIRQQLEALEQGQRRLLQAEKLAAIGQLAAGMAHEIRNPLGVIRASAGMILQELPADSEVQRAGEFICEEVDRLNALVTALLSFARPLAPHRTHFGFDELEQAVMLRLEDKLLRRADKLEWVGRGQKPLYADRDLLLQVLLTLLTNALQFIPSGGQIRIDYSHSAALMRLSVSDDGVGVPEADRERLFQAFFSTRNGGTGLGLAMAARIMESHGGLLEYHPDEGLGAHGKGATFVLTLPSDANSPAEFMQEMSR